MLLLLFFILNNLFFPVDSMLGFVGIVNLDDVKYLSIFSLGSSILIANSKAKTPFLTNIISSTISPSFTKISFLYAIIGLKARITFTIKSVF